MVISSSSKVPLLFHRQTGAEYINLIRQWADSRLSCSSCKSTFIASSYSLALQKFQLNFSSSVGSEFQFLSPQSWDVTSEFFFFSVLQQVSSWPLSLFILTILPVLEEKATTCQVVCLEITFSWGSWPLKSWTTLVSHGSNFALQFCGVDQKVLKDFMPYSHRPTLGFPFRSFFLSFFFPY